MAKLINQDFKKLNVIIDQGENYFSRLRHAHLGLLKKGAPNYLTFSYLILCAATLEYSLNWLYFDFCIKKFGSPFYAADFLTMNFKAKLHLAPITVTSHKFQFELNNPAIKDIQELIHRRNSMLHNKSYIIEINAEAADENGTVNFEVKNHIESLSKEECFAYGDALGKLKSDLLDPYRKNNIIETDLIIQL